MSQISRFPLKQSVRNEILHSLWWLIANLQKEEEVAKFLDEFLTKTEKVMFAKRLAIVLMLEKGYSYYDIRDTLKVSTSTVQRIAQWLEKRGEGYQLALNKLARKKQLESFWQVIGEMIEMIGKGKRVFPRSK